MYIGVFDKATLPALARVLAAALARYGRGSLECAQALMPIPPEYRQYALGLASEIIKVEYDGSETGMD